MTSASVPDDVVYEVVKAVFENFDRFKGLHPAFENLTEEVMQELSARIDLDKEKPAQVAADYLREAGYTG